jgi:hypothetical protein
MHQHWTPHAGTILHNRSEAYPLDVTFTYSPPDPETKVVSYTIRFIDVKAPPRNIRLSATAQNARLIGDPDLKGLITDQLVQSVTSQSTPATGAGAYISFKGGQARSRVFDPPTRAFVFPIKVTASLSDGTLADAQFDLRLLRIPAQEGNEYDGI